jgi:hypothetical protein
MKQLPPIDETIASNRDGRVKRLPPIEMGDGAAPVASEFRPLGSLLSKNVAARFPAQRLAPGTTPSSASSSNANLSTRSSRLEPNLRFGSWMPTESARYCSMHQVLRHLEWDTSEGASLRVDRYQHIAARCLNLDMSEKTKVTKTKAAIQQDPYSPTDLKQDLQSVLSNLAP